jgi:small-conductance mechanosensitive channel
VSRERTGHILNAASNLLGIALIIIAGLNVSHAARNGLADEVAWAAALCFGTSCFLSYVALRDEAVSRRREEKWADRVFLVGLVALIGAILVLAIESR